MISIQFWKRIAENWSKDDDGIDIPDVDVHAAKDIKDEDLVLFDDISNDEINDILADLGLDDI